MSLQPKSIAGLVRSAFERLGWDAKANDVASIVGPVWQGRSQWSVRAGDWETEWVLALVTNNYINSVRRKFKPSVTVTRVIVDDSTPLAEFCRIAAGVA